jgi:hypothetical protein
MSDQRDHEGYPLHEGANDAGGDDGRDPSGAPAETGASAGDDSSLPLEPHERQTAPAGFCQRCGAPLHAGANDGVECLRCGLAVTAAVVPSTQLVPDSDDDDAPGRLPHDERDEEAGPPLRPLVHELPLDPWGVVGVGIAAFLALAIAHLLGAHAMYPADLASAGGDAAEPLSFGERLVSVIRMFVLLGLWTAGGTGAIIASAWLFTRPVGDLLAAAGRVFAIIAVSRLVAFIDLPGPTVEGLLEAALQLGVIYLLTMLVFRLKPRDALTVLVIAVVALLLLFVGAILVTWASNS